MLLLSLLMLNVVKNLRSGAMIRAKLPVRAFFVLCVNVLTRIFALDCCWDNILPAQEIILNIE